MNILMILTNGFDPDLRVYKEAKYLANTGNKVEILCWDRDNRYSEKRNEIIDGIKITRFHESSSYGSGLKQIFKLFKFKKDCKKYIKKNKIKCDVMHCHDLDGMIIGYLIRKRKTKLVFDMHEYYNSGSYAKIYAIVKVVLKFLQNKAFKIIHVNEQQTKEMSEKNKKKLIHIPNYPETNRFKEVKHKESETLRITYAGYVRYLTPLVSLAKAVNELDNVEVSIYGSGDKYEETKELEKIYKNFNVYGKYEYDEIIEFYSNSDLIYIVYDKGNKNAETALPTKFFESIASELPMIVAKDSLLEENIKKYDIGFSVDGTEYLEIKQLLEEIIKNKKILEKKIINIKNIPDKFSWEEIVKNLDKIYKE